MRWSRRGLSDVPIGSLNLGMFGVFEARQSGVQARPGDGEIYRQDRVCPSELHYRAVV